VIEPRQVDRLKQMGAWLAKNGASVYGTRGGPWKPTRDVASTRRGHEIFVHLLRNDTGTIELTDIGRRVKSATRLDGGQPVKFRQQDGKLTLTPGKTPASTIDLVIRLELDGSAMDLPAIALPTGIKATASNVANNDPALGPKQAFDQDPATRWTTAPGTTKAWIAADLGRPRTIQRVRIEEVTGDHITNFELQYRDGSAWKTVLSGSKVGYWFDEKIPPVTAREFRLVILDAKSAPVIAEIEFVEL
jgi:alpha-L-fucosidase